MIAESIESHQIDAHTVSQKMSRASLVPDAKMLIYSGHDSTLVPILCALGIYQGILIVDENERNKCTFTFF